MVELQLTNGDFVPNGMGDFCRLEGSRALIQRSRGLSLIPG